MENSARTLAETTIKMLGDRWKVQIIECLMSGTKRFGELKRELGDITQKVLTSNLRMLEENGILVRHVYAQIPPRVDYTLTNLGYNLRPVIDSMVTWAEEYRDALMNEFNHKLEQGKEKITESRAILGNAIEQGRVKLESKIKELKDSF
ncbi:MAG: helix-turn-helix transcriptional regulator [Alphaproteobacteria bacterium]|nr:helix-turn-helix transcriptional regulator [Alphaproteobacteria bacterium]